MLRCVSCFYTVVASTICMFWPHPFFYALKVNILEKRQNLRCWLRKPGRLAHFVEELIDTLCNRPGIETLPTGLIQPPDTRRIVFFYPADFWLPQSLSTITSTINTSAFRRSYLFKRSKNIKHYYHWMTKTKYGGYRSDQSRIKKKIVNHLILLATAICKESLKGVRVVMPVKM